MRLTPDIPVSDRNAARGAKSEPILYRIYQRGMIRSPFGDRIISSYNKSVQNLKEKFVSSALTSGLSGPLNSLSDTNNGEGQAISYLAGLESSQLTSYPPAHHLPAGQPDRHLPTVATASEQTGFEYFADEEDEETHQAEDEEESPDPYSSDRTRDDPERTGVIYARVSTDDQAEHSIDTQIDNMESVAEDEDITLVREPITDEGETGTNFDRNGIKKVFDVASDGDITHLLVDDVSRIGRNAPQTIYFIYILQEECNVTIVTNRGELDTSRVNDLLDTTLQALVSHMSAKQRGRKARDTRIRRFREERIWSSWFRHIPLGYREREDGWIEPNPKEVPVVTAMFEYFLKTESYAETQDRLEEMAETDDDLNIDLTARQVKQYLQRPVYVGKPSMNIESRDDDAEQGIVHDDDLQIVDEETYDAVQETIAEKKQKHSSDDSAVDADDFVDAFGVIPVLESGSIVELVCPECGGQMVKNGQRTLSDGWVHNYICNDCGRQRKYPNENEMADMIERFQNLMEKLGKSLEEE